MIQEGWILDKWGQVKLPLHLKAEWAKDALNLYLEFAAAMEEKFELRPFLVAGTLLGAVRDNDFIGHDDDLDFAYFSGCQSANEVRYELFEIIVALRSMGWDAQVGHNGGFFKLRSGAVEFDVFPSWHQDGRVWLPQSQSMPDDASLMDPPKRAVFKDQWVWYPNRPEDYLRHHYGEAWRTPDPNYLERKKPGVLATLKQARLSRDEMEKVNSVPLGNIQQRNVLSE